MVGLRVRQRRVKTKIRKIRRRLSTPTCDLHSTIKMAHPKKVSLELESMRVPVQFIPGQYSVHGVIIDDQITWADVRGEKGNGGYDTVAEIRTLQEMMQKRKAARKN